MKIKLPQGKNKLNFLPTHQRDDILIEYMNFMPVKITERKIANFPRLNLFRFA